MPAKKNTTNVRDLLNAARAMLAALEARDVEAQQNAAESMEAAVNAIDPPIPTDPVEMLATMRLEWTSRKNAGAGTWATGTIAGHTFQALVFPEHAEVDSYELDKSHISKLHLREQATGNEVATFDRGWDLRPTTDAAKAIVDLLAAGLAETVYGK